MNQPRRKWRVKIRRDDGRQEELGIVEAAYHGEAYQVAIKQFNVPRRWSGFSCLILTECPRQFLVGPKHGLMRPIAERGIFAVPERIRLRVAVGHASIAATAIHSAEPALGRFQHEPGSRCPARAGTAKAPPRQRIRPAGCSAECCASQILIPRRGGGREVGSAAEFVARQCPALAREPCHGGIEPHCCSKICCLPDILGEQPN